MVVLQRCFIRWPALHDDHFWLVPRVVVLYRFDCNISNFFVPLVFHVGLCSYEWKCIILTWSALHLIRYENIYHKCLNLASVNGFYLWYIYSTCKGKYTLYYRKLRNKPVYRDFLDFSCFPKRYFFKYWLFSLWLFV